jgi:TonB family protein
MRFKLLTIAFLIVTTYAVTQTVPSVDEPTARQHLLKHDPPIYPAIAKAAHVSGSVILQLQIAADGTVSSVEILSGPGMLYQAAEDAVTQWTFKPFEVDRRPTNVTTTITIPFGLNQKIDPNDAKLDRLFSPALQKCLALTGPQSDTVTPTKVCQEAADIASQFSSDYQSNGRRLAYIYAANAFLKNNQPKESLAYANKAVALVGQGQGHIDASGASGAFSQRALALAGLGDLAGADRDLTIAEDYQRKAIDSPVGRGNPIAYVGTLKNILNLHIQVLDAMGKTDKALAKRDELGKL